MTLPPRKIGLFGGSFDPPHNGHLICARAASLCLNLEKVIVIPAANQPRKPEGTFATGDQRLKMVHAAFSGLNRFEVSTLELVRGGPSYTIDTIREINKSYPAPEFTLYLIVGADTLADMPNWKEPDEIFRSTIVASMVRTTTVVPEFQPGWVIQIIRLDTPKIDISSREIRRKVAVHESIEGLVPEEVNKIIKTESLYIVQESTRLTPVLDLARNG